MLETRETTVQPKATHTRVHSRDSNGKEHTVVIERDGRNVVAKYAGPDKTSATVKIVDGKPQSSDLGDKPVVKKAIQAELARLLELDGPGAANFDLTATPDNGTIGINWKCEIATLKVIAKCGTFQILECGAAVQEQMCKCAPKDANGNPPPGCE